MENSDPEPETDSVCLVTESQLGGPFILSSFAQSGSHEATRNLLDLKPQNSALNTQAFTTVSLSQGAVTLWSS